MNEAEIPHNAAKNPAEADYQYLSKQLQRLRLLLKRRALWLRSQWADDSLQGYQGLVISDTKADWLLAGEDRSAEELFYSQDPAASEIGKALAELEPEMAGMGVLSEAMPSLEILVSCFNLTAFEREVLLLCLAPELDPSFERIYAYVQDDVNHRYATPHLALTLFDSNGGSPEARFSLSPDGTLRRFGLVTLEPGPMPAAARGLRPLKIDENVANYLLGMRQLDERAAELLWAVTSVPLPASYSAIVDDLGRFVRPELDNRRSLSINLIGPAGSGRMAVASALCDCLGLRLFRLEHQRVPTTEPDRREILRLLEREALLFQAALYIEVGEEDTASRESADHIGRVIDNLHVHLIVGSRTKWRSSHALNMISVEMQKPDAITRHLIWQKVMPCFSGSLEPVSQQFDFGPHDIVEAAASAELTARLRGSPNPDSYDLWNASREQSAWQAEGLAQLIVPVARFEDIVLPKDTFDLLEEIAAQVSNRPKVYDEWGFGRKLSRGKGISALFSGPSGAGKTMAAEILANHLNLDLYRIDLAGVVSKYIGETEKNLKKVFDAAEMSGAILFFDEADALFGKRTEVKDSHDRYANIEVNYLLQRMEDYRGLAILATNRKSFLDQAFMRRIRFTVDFPFPDAKSRKLIWQKMFPEEALQEYVFGWYDVPGKDDERLINFLRHQFGIECPAIEGIEKNSNDKTIKVIAGDKSLLLELNDDKTEVILKISDGSTSKLVAKDENGELKIYFRESIDYDALSRLEITGGNDKNIAVNAAFLAAEECRPIGMNHIMRSAKREYAKIDKLLSEAEFGEYYKLVKS